MNTKHNPEQMDLQACLRMIAQGAVNISEGHTTIEAGSSVHRAMYDLLDHVNAIAKVLRPFGPHYYPARAFEAAARNTPSPSQGQ